MQPNADTNGDAARGPFYTGPLRPGAVVTGPGARAQYSLRAQIHQGPRSDVWVAAEQEADGEGGASASPSPPPRLVAVKFTSSKRQRASHNEADVMRQLTQCSLATGPRGFAAPLLDAFEFCASPPPARPEFGGAGAGAGAGANGAATATAAALVTPAYGPSAVAVIRGLRAERGRGLPRRAVRRMARSLLGALAHLHGPCHRMAYLDLKPHNLVLELPPPRDGGNGDGGEGYGDGAGDLRSGEGKAAAAAAGGAPPRKKKPPPPQRQQEERWRLVDFGNSSPLVRAGPWPLSHLPASFPFAPFGWRAARLPEYASPAYEAPESVLRLAGCPAAPADVWALGCLLFEAAAGGPLFSPLVVVGGDDDAEQENDSDSGGDEDEEGEEGGGGAGGAAGGRWGPRERRRWRRRVFSTAAEARLLSSVHATLGPAPRRVLRRSPVWQDYYDDRGEPWDDLGGALASRALARRAGSTGLRGWRLEDKVGRVLGAPSAWGKERAAAFAAFLRPMLVFDPDRRATAEGMLMHEWLLSSSEEVEEEEEQGAGGDRGAPPPARRRQELRVEELKP